MRYFLLENENGERFSFQNIENSLSYTLNGLGIVYSSSYSKLGEYFVANSKELTQKSIDFNCLFRSPILYRKLINFTSKAKKISLVYIDDKEYYLDIEVTAINKVDIIRRDFIKCSITIVNTSLFYEKKEQKYQIDITENPNRWDFRWNLEFVDVQSGKVFVDIIGNADSAFQMEITQAGENPKIEITSEDGSVQTVQFNLTLETDEVLYYSTVDNDLYVYTILNNIKTNRINSLNYLNDNFPKLKIGYNEIKVTNISTAKLTVFDAYVSV